MLVSRNDDLPGDEGAARVWALTPGRLVAHWLVDVALWAVTIVLPVIVVHQHPDDVASVFGAVCTIGFAGAALVLAVQQLRAGTAVWIEPATNTVIVFRASGGTFTTTPNRVQRIDRGRRLKADSPYSPVSGFPPLRVVTAEGTVRLSPFLGPAIEIADALTAHNSRIDVDL